MPRLQRTPPTAPWLRTAFARQERWIGPGGSRAPLAAERPPPRHSPPPLTVPAQRPEWGRHEAPATAPLSGAVRFHRSADARVGLTPCRTSALPPASRVR